MRLFFLTALAMTAFAGNSLLCRLALKNTAIDAATFTAIRMVSGALVLWVLIRLRGKSASATIEGNWWSALALFAYAATFSFAYVTLSAGTGALLLFGAVQASMIGYGLWRGERLRPLQWLGVALALCGLTGLLLPGISAPPAAGAALMLAAGVAWGVYSLRGRSGGAPLNVTAGNFLRAAPMALVLCALCALTGARLSSDPAGVVFAIASGALASGVGYAIWYTALPALKAATAATVQLSVPVLAAVGGIVFLAEPLSARLMVAALAVLGGIALVVLTKQRTGN